VLAAAGARVAATARRIDRLQQLASEVEGVVPIPCDISSDDGLQQLVQEAREQLGPIGVLVNNAGIVGGRTPAEHVERGSVEATLAVNLVAPIRLSALVFPDMRELGGGSIVNVSSISGLVGIGAIPQVSYVASKTGLVGATRELALQWAPYGIRVNVIAPGFFESEMTSRTFSTPELTRWVESNTPLPRHGQVGDFAGALLLLASDAGRFITGQALVVDGGWTAR
jgi:NAD(P)-dependent dehydrogenase (short-subunit alcohol dehydrogenase family)